MPKKKKRDGSGESRARAVYEKLIAAKVPGECRDFPSDDGLQESWPFLKLLEVSRIAYDPKSLRMENLGTDQQADEGSL